MDRKVEKHKIQKNNISEFTSSSFNVKAANLGINMNFLGKARFCNEHYGALCVYLTLLRIKFATGFQFIVQ